MPEPPSNDEVEAAARALFAHGHLYHWWPSSAPTYESLDPIGKEEFDAIVERVLIAAAKVRGQGRE